MEYQVFHNDKLSKKVDYYHTFAPDNIDLIAEYLYEVHNINLPRPASTRDLWDNPPSELATSFFKMQQNGVNPGDIVIHGNGVGLATGIIDDHQVELLQQDGICNVVKVDKTQVIGLIRHNQSKALEMPIETPEQPVMASEPNESLMATLPKVHKLPHGALHVPLATQRILIKTELATYPTSGLAVKREQPTNKLIRVGMQEFDLLQNGMLRVAGTTVWINPTDNVPKPIRPPQAEYKPELDGAKEAEENFVNFHTGDDPNAPLEERPYLARSSGAMVLEFATGKTITMPAGKRVWLAGYTRVGDLGYGIATKCLEDAEGRPLARPKWIGISLGQLKPDDTFNTDTSLQDRQALRTLKPQDYLTLARAKVQKKILDIRKVQ